ncbi:MAG: hypothetical protein AAGB03_01435, partial [Pseudomonadota bacterium]
ASAGKKTPATVTGWTPSGTGAFGCAAPMGRLFTIEQQRQATLSALRPSFASFEGPYAAGSEY